MLTNRLYALLAMCFMLLTWSACSDDPASSGSDDMEPPQMPTIAPFLSENLSFFDNDLDAEELRDDEAYSAFLILDEWIGFVRLGDVGQSFIISSMGGDEPDYQEGEWIWENHERGWYEEGDPDYDVYKDDYMDHRLVARTVDGGTEWIHSVVGILDGVAFDAPVFLEGFISDDESNGLWKEYSIYNSHTPWMITEWTIESDSKMTYKMVYSEDEEEEEDGVEDAELIEYVRNAPDNHVTTDIWVEIYWNEDTGMGWVSTKEGETICFDRNNGFKNVECSD